MRLMIARRLASTALVTTLAACVSSGDDSSVSNGFTTAEFNRSTGLDQIRAAQGYARVQGRQGGAGIKVAVIDEGMAANNDYNIVAEAFFAPDIGFRNGDHGTAVAGIVGARKNDIGTHGVAFNSDIVNIQVFDDAGSVPDGRLSVAIDAGAGLVGSQPDLESDVLNMSLGGGPILNDVLISMRNAASRDKIMVMAAGNDGSADPLFPGVLVTDAGMQGQGIVVGSVDADNNLSSFSARCGSAAAFCMVAPGEDIVTTGVNDLVRVSGTSFAAPMVSGAAAVVKAAFPGVSGAAVVDRLLTSATDLGTAGVDTVFGHGLLNLDNALDPNGTLSVAASGTVDGPRAPVAGSRMLLGSAASLDDQGRSLLRRTMALDEDNFPFNVDLTGSARESPRSSGLANFVERVDRISAVTSGAGSTFALSVSADQTSFSASDQILPPAGERGDRLEPAAPTLQLQSSLGTSIGMFFAVNGASGTPDDLSADLLGRGGSGLAEGAFLAPYDQLAGAQSGGGASIALAEATTLTLAAFDAADNELSDDRLRAARLQKLALKHRTYGDVELRLGLGALQEQGGFLGSDTSGAFGSDTASQSVYLDASVLAPVTTKLALFGAYTRGSSTASAGGSSLLGDYSQLASDAFGAGLLLRDVAADGDGFSLMVGQPLRITDGSATVDVPVSRSVDGQVQRESAEVDLAPEGREIATEAVYRFALTDASHQSLATGAFLRLNPDHDPNAAPDLGVGVRYQWRF